jgi:hypothetical protein
MIPASDRVRIGEFEVIRLLDGTFRVDGGAMFGVVPRTLWAAKAAPDAENRITLALNSYVIRTPETTILVDTGVGPDVGRRHIDFYSFERRPGLLAGLAELGLGPDGVDIVVNSHLHFDHCGGNTVRAADGTWAPAFPRARYVVQRGEWEQALHPLDRDKPSYLPARLKGLAEGRGSGLDGDGPLAPGVEAVSSPAIPPFTRASRSLRQEDVLLSGRRRAHDGPHRSRLHYELRPLPGRHVQQRDGPPRAGRRRGLGPGLQPRPRHAVRVPAARR